MDIQPIKGTRDLVGLKAQKMRYVASVFSAIAELYGFRPIVTPILEHTEVFSRGTGVGSDVVRKEMYTFKDKGERSVTMRPEFTAGIVRSIITNKLYATEDLPLKLYYEGPAFRYERPQLGRLREFHQFGIETIGSDSPLLDAEALATFVQALRMLGFQDLKIKVNSLGDEESRTDYKKRLKEYFLKHLDNMCADCHERFELNPLRMLDCKVPSDQELAKNAPSLRDSLTVSSKERFETTLDYLTELGIEFEIDDNLVRGLDYYSEFVFEIHVTSPIGHDYGAIGGGGHYGNLVKELGGPDLSGVGFACGEERIVALMEEFGLFDSLDESLDLYLVPIGETAFKEGWRLLEDIRSLGFRADMPPKEGKLSSLIKKAVKRKARFALIFGEEELGKGTAKLKNLLTEEQTDISLETLDEDLDHLIPEEEEHECCHGGQCHCHEHEEHK